MQVPADQNWHLAGVALPSSITFQNVGDNRIAYVYAAALPAAGSITPDSDGHFIANPGMYEIVRSDLKTLGLSLYVYNLGPVPGQLAVVSAV